MKEFAMTVLDGSDFDFDFSGADASFRSDLEKAFPGNDITQRSSFSGAELISLAGVLTPVFVTAVSTFLVQAKKSDASRKIKIKCGRDNEISLENFGGDDLASMEPAVLKIVEAMKSKK
jgi:hypothetical protein